MPYRKDDNMTRLGKNPWFSFVLGTLWAATFLVNLVEEGFILQKTYLFVLAGAAILFYSISVIQFIKNKTLKKDSY